MRLKRSLLNWLPLAVAVTGLSFLVYVAVQQNYRNSLNDPQVQVVNDAALALAQGAVPAEIVPRFSMLIDIKTNLGMFISIYDKDDKSLESSGVYENAPPVPPVGVLDYTREHGEDSITWQPDSETRIALVLKSVNNDKGWVVAAGRNMSEVEGRISRLGAQILIAWLFILAGTLLAEFIRSSYVF